MQGEKYEYYGWSHLMENRTTEAGENSLNYSYNRLSTQAVVYSG